MSWEAIGSITTKDIRTGLRNTLTVRGRGATPIGAILSRELMFARYRLGHLGDKAGWANARRSLSRAR